MREDQHSRNFIILMILVTIMAIIIAFTSKNEVNSVAYVPVSKVPAEEPAYLAEVKDGIHLPTGLKADMHLDLVLGNCLACHSADVIRNTRLSKEGWNSIIEWMQKKQNLWDLGKNHDKIVAYLAKNYAPDKQGRRKQLAIQSNDWYVLED